MTLTSHLQSSPANGGFTTLVSHANISVTSSVAQSSPYGGAFSMARRRMFSSTIVENDVFLDMPLSTQALYFHLCMNADDDGFVSPKRVMRMVGANEDDLKVLITKRYVLSFESGVIIVKHWQVNNLIRKDRYHETTYKDELKSLTTNNFGAYTEIHKITTHNPELTEKVAKEATTGQPKVNRGKVRLGKSSLGKVRYTTNVVGAEAPIVYGKPEINDMFDYWEQVVGYKINSKVDKNRRACYNLIKRQGESNLKRFIVWVDMAHGDRFATKECKIADFMDLQENLKYLLVWAKGRSLEETKPSGRGWRAKSK